MSNQDALNRIGDLERSFLDYSKWKFAKVGKLPLVAAAHKKKSPQKGREVQAKKRLARATKQMVRAANKFYRHKIRRLSYIRILLKKFKIK